MDTTQHHGDGIVGGPALPIVPLADLGPAADPFPAAPGVHPPSAEGPHVALGLPAAPRPTAPLPTARLDRAVLARGGAAAVAALAVLASFGPWLRTGAAERTSYEVIRAADRLDVVGGTGQTLLSAVWAFFPLLAALGGLALALDRPRLAAAALAVAGLVEALLALLVLQAPGAAPWGTQLGLTAGPLLVVAAALLLVLRTNGSSR